MTAITPELVRQLLDMQEPHVPLKGIARPIAEAYIDAMGELEKVQGFLKECHRVMDYHGITGAWRPSS